MSKKILVSLTMFFILILALSTSAWAIDRPVSDVTLERSEVLSAQVTLSAMRASQDAMLVAGVGSGYDIGVLMFVDSTCMVSSISTVVKSANDEVETILMNEIPASPSAGAFDMEDTSPAASEVVNQKAFAGTGMYFYLYCANPVGSNDTHMTVDSAYNLEGTTSANLEGTTSAAIMSFGMVRTASPHPKTATEVASRKDLAGTGMYFYLYRANLVNMKVTWWTELDVEAGLEITMNDKFQENFFLCSSNDMKLTEKNVGSQNAEHNTLFALSRNYPNPFNASDGTITAPLVLQIC